MASMNGELSLKTSSSSSPISSRLAWREALLLGLGATVVVVTTIFDGSFKVNE